MLNNRLFFCQTLTFLSTKGQVELQFLLKIQTFILSTHANQTKLTQENISTYHTQLFFVCLPS